MGISLVQLNGHAVLLCLPWQWLLEWHRHLICRLHCAVDDLFKGSYFSLKCRYSGVVTVFTEGCY